MATLKHLLGYTELYLVAGSDVIRNASAYRSTELGSAAEYNHIVFYRDREEEAQKPPLSSFIQGKLETFSLPAFFETVSSTRIRESVDQNLDISMLVDPVVQSFIYENGLYLRTPERKNILRREDLYFRRFRAPSPELPGEMARLLSQKKSLWALFCELDLKNYLAGSWGIRFTEQTSMMHSNRWKLPITFAATHQAVFY